MNEAQTLLDIENLMLSACRRGYHCKDFKSYYEQWLDDARSVYHPDLDYSPLVKAYFDLMLERIDRDQQYIFEDNQSFKSFQRHLRQQNQYFIQDKQDQSDDYQERLESYFTSLINRHRKLLLVRVDLSYRFEKIPRIQNFVKDIKKLITRIQNKDTIFKNQVGYAYRLEQGGRSKGYHCHLLVIYNGSERCRDSYLAQSIGELWRDKITQNDGLFYNCNQKSRKRYFEDEGTLGIGLVERSKQMTVINAYKTINYLTRYKPDQYLRVKINRRMRVFHTGQIKHRDERQSVSSRYSSND